MEEFLMKIGDLADLFGVTVRTLHYYHQIGLLIPSQTTASGHRLYNENDVKRLYQIITLKNFGFSLEEIGKMTSSTDSDPLVLINLQVQKAAEALEFQQALYNRLVEVQKKLKAESSPSLADMVALIEIAQHNSQNYLTQEQIAQLKSLYSSFSIEQEVNMKKEWQSFVARLGVCKEENKPVDSDDMQELAAYWQDFLKTFSDIDQDIVDAAHKFHAENKDPHLNYGLTHELYEYLSQAIEAMNDEC